MTWRLEALERRVAAGGADLHRQAVARAKRIEDPVVRWWMIEATDPERLRQRLASIRIMSEAEAEAALARIDGELRQIWAIVSAPLVETGLRVRKAKRARVPRSSATSNWRANTCGGGNMCEGACLTVL